MTIALICSGQGRIERAMLSALADDPAAAPILAAAATALGQDPLRFLEHASDAELHANRASQILCVTRSLAAAASLPPGALPADTIVTGYSIGEVAAWGVAGVWSAVDTIALAARRAEAMDHSAASAPGMLGHVRGLAEQAVEDLCTTFRCFIAIRNPDRLFVIGGRRTDVLALCEEALARGAARAAAMTVAVASHTPLLSDAVEPLQAALHDVPRRRPGLRLMSTTTQSLVHDMTRSLSDLARQVANPIDWSATLDALQERGVTRLLELGPGSALAAMAHSLPIAWEARSVDDFGSSAAAADWLGHSSAVR